MGDRKRTGIVPLDRKLGGGIPTGSTVLFTAPPASQAELILASIAGQHETLYLATERPDESVRATLEQNRSRDEAVHVSHVDNTDPLGDVYRQLREATLPDVVVVDRIETLEREGGDGYRSLLETLTQKARATDTVVVLHGTDSGATTSERERTAYVADIVFELETEFDGNTLTNRLFVPKFRGGKALPDPLSLELTERIFVDTSRDIA